MRKFLVILDDSRECLNAMRFAAMRAAKTGGGVEVLAIIPPEEFNHWIGVGDIMRAEARERIEALHSLLAADLEDHDLERDEGWDPTTLIDDFGSSPPVASTSDGSV